LIIDARQTPQISIVVKIATAAIKPGLLKKRGFTNLPFIGIDSKPFLENCPQLCFGIMRVMEGSWLIRNPTWIISIVDLLYMDVKDNIYTNGILEGGKAICCSLPSKKPRPMIWELRYAY
jgi:hypothetical protein